MIISFWKLINHHWERVPSGIADATGEKTRFQGKNGFFHWGLLFFQSAFSGFFPLESTRGEAFDVAHGSTHAFRCAVDISLCPLETALKLASALAICPRWKDAVRFSQSVLGIDRVPAAMD